MKKTNTLLLLLFMFSFLLIASSCAKSEDVSNCLEAHTYGFWGGLLHGILAPIGFVGMLINDDYTMYAQNNNGGWYALGFLLGSGGWGLLAGSRKSK